MTDLLKENVPFEWSEEQQSTFDKIEQVLLKKSSLKLYNPKAAVTDLHTDASTAGLGAILLLAD